MRYKYNNVYLYYFTKKIKKESFIMIYVENIKRKVFSSEMRLNKKIKKYHSPKNIKNFFQRVHSFCSNYWSNKSEILSPYICSRYGWVCTSINILQCFTCQEIIIKISKKINSLVDRINLLRFRTMLTLGHHNKCPWRRKICPKAFCHLPLEQVIMKHQFLKSLSSYKACFQYIINYFCLPIININVKDKLLNELPKYNQKHVTDLMLLASCGWMLNTTSSEFKFSKSSNLFSSKKIYLHCFYCNMKLKLRTFKIKTQYKIVPASSESNLKKLILFSKYLFSFPTGGESFLFNRNFIKRKVNSFEIDNKKTSETNILTKSQNEKFKRKKNIVVEKNILTEKSQKIKDIQKKLLKVMDPIDSHRIGCAYVSEYFYNIGSSKVPGWVHSIKSMAFNPLILETSLEK